VKYTHIVFDVDGTLLNNEEVVLYSLRDVVREMLSKDMPIDDLRFALGIPSANTLIKLGIEDMDCANRLWQKFYTNYAKNDIIFDGISECLQLLYDKGNILGIITSKTTAEYKNEFVPLGLAHYFNVVVCADDTVNHKPHSEPMMMFLDRANAEAKTTLYIGDTVNDSYCAQGAGVDFALALWGCKKPEGILATYRLSTPFEVSLY